MMKAKKARQSPASGSEELALWYSRYLHPNINYQVTGPGFKPKVAPVTIAVEYPYGVFRKIVKVAPYSLPDGGFAVMMPYHMEDAGSLSKMQAYDTLSRSLILPPPTVIEAYSVSSKAKLSFHSDGVTQFSSIIDGTIISGRDPTTGEFKGLVSNAGPSLVLSGAVLYWQLTLGVSMTSSSVVQEKIPSSLGKQRFEIRI